MSVNAHRLTFKDYREIVNHPQCIKVGGKVKLPPGRVTQEQIDGALALDVRPGDIFVTSYPKSGTTWTQAILWWIINVQKEFSVRGNIDEMEPPSMADLKRNHHRFIDLNGAANLESLPLPRVFVSHLPFDLVPKLEIDGTKSTVEANDNVFGDGQGDDVHVPTSVETTGDNKAVKYIHVIRDPKDAVISYFHMLQMVYKIPDSDLDFFIEQFINGTGIYGDYFDCVKSWWSQRYNPNVLIVFYEEMLDNLRKQIMRIAEFLSDTYVNYDQVLKDNQAIVDTIIGATSFSAMKQTHLSSLNEETKQFANFYRKGIRGDYITSMTKDQIKAINDRIKNELGQPFVHMYVKRDGYV